MASEKIKIGILGRRDLKEVKIKLIPDDDAIEEWANGKIELGTCLPDYLPDGCDVNWEEFVNGQIRIILFVRYPVEKEKELIKKLEEYSDKHIFTILV